MKKKTKIILSVILSFFVLLASAIGALAYYEYYGQYSTIINLDGTIKVDAFDVLYEELRLDDSYGVTPENPYVIDNYVRLNNLIRLNNSGKLKKVKNDKSISKFYFCLEFDEEDLPQVLNLAEVGLFSSIGNNDYAFEDELAGIVYGYELTAGNIIYYSGCIPTVEVSDGKFVTDGTATSLSDGTYLHLERSYSKTLTDGMPTAFVTSGTDYEEYINLSNTTTIHQVIANETIVADTEQIDVGFISRIAQQGYVHDVILYNTNIICAEEEEKTLFDYLVDFITGGIFTINDAAGNAHTHADEASHSDERHIGIFTGHLDGSAAKISVAGTSNFSIETTGVNYYSNYTTVGFVSSTGTIGGVTIETLSSEVSSDDGNISGCLFADDIYDCVVGGTTSYTDYDNATHYRLTDIDADSSVHWPGVTNSSYFSYGSFRFVLSSANDTISNIWSNSGALSLLNKSGYTINGTVLYMADEYRYSNDVTQGGSIISTAASVKETVYSGLSDLQTGGNVIDTGNYLICAKVPDATKTGGYAYYALKLTSPSTGIYEFDATEENDVTAYVLDTTGSKKLYQSAIWTVESPSSTPTFVNSRFEGEYLSVDNSGVGITELQASATALSIDIENYSVYFTLTSTSGGATSSTPYYLTYDVDSGSFDVDSEKQYDFVVYRISNGYSLEMVDDTADFVVSNEYLIVARDNTNSYILGMGENSDGLITGEFATDKVYTTTSFPLTVDLDEYDDIKNYIWKVNSVDSGAIKFKDKSGTYYLDIDNGALAAKTTGDVSWTYNQGSGQGGSLANGSSYINFNVSSNGTGFSIGNSAFTLYIYHFIAQDAQPLYVSYDGGKHLDTTSTELEAADYVIVANVNNTLYALGLSSTTTVTSTQITISGDSTTFTDSSNTNNYYWTIASKTDSPVLKNKNYSSSRLFAAVSGNTMTLSGNTSTDFTWYYDAVESKLYCEISNTKYYLTYSNSTFTISNTSSTIIELYQTETQYELNNITLATFTSTSNTNITTTTTTNNYYYFMSIYNITNVNYNPILLGWAWDQALSHTGSLNGTYSDQWLGAKKNYTMDTNPYSNGSIKTTDESILSALWGFTGSVSASSPGYLYNKYFEKNYVALGYTATLENYKELGKIYLSANDNTGNRDIAMTTIAQYGKGSGNYNSGFYTRSATHDSTTNANIGFKGGGNTYYIYYDITTTNGTSVYNFNIKSSASASKAPYMYRCVYAESTILRKISANGDELDNNINYAIAAYDQATNKYQGLSYDTDNGVYATDLTSYVGEILSASDGIYSSTVNLPRVCDWTAVATNSSDKSQTLFYNTSCSNTSNRYFLDYISSTLTTNNLATSETTDDVMKLYYDSINKRMKCIKGSTTYYLTYDDANGFGLSTNNSNAAEIHLFRYNATYSVELVTSYASCLMNGDFVVAGHSSDGWIAIGSDGNTLLTDNYTHLLRNEITEAEYNSMSNYIFSQLEYGTNESGFNTAVNAGSIKYYMQNKSKTGSFAVKTSAYSGTYLLGYPDPVEWSISQSNGVWKFITAHALGDATAGAYGVDFVDTNAGSASLTMSTSYESITGYLTLNGIASGNAVRIFKTDGTELTGSLELNGTYIIIAKDNTSKQWKVIGYDEVNESIIYSTIGKEMGAGNALISTYMYSEAETNNLTDYNNNLYYVRTGEGTSANPYIFTQATSYDATATYYTPIYRNWLKASTAGTYGYNLQFMIDTNFYLIMGASTVMAEDDSSIYTNYYWKYKYDSVYTENSRLCMVKNASASGNLMKSGNRITSAKGTTGYATYLYDSNGNLVIGSLTSNTNYAIVLYEAGYYYVLELNDAGNVVPTIYGSGLPTSFKNSELWTYDGSNFKSTADSTEYLHMATDGNLAVTTTVPSGITWSYSATTGTYSYTYCTSSNATNELYLFYIKKSDMVAETADIQSPLSYHALVTPSLSILDSTNYVIVAEYNNRHYALAMKTRDTSITLDITDTFDEAYDDGGNLKIYNAAVWNQIGSDYSLVFDNIGFNPRRELSTVEYNWTKNTDFTALYSVTITSSSNTIGSEISTPTADTPCIIVNYKDGIYYTYRLDTDGTYAEKSYGSSLPVGVTEGEVWKYISNSGDDYTFTTNSLEVDVPDYNLLYGTPTYDVNGYIVYDSAVQYYEELPSDLEQYTWTIFTTNTSNHDYILGNYNSSTDQTWYIYFDGATLSFKLTDNADTAKGTTTTSRAKIYQLGQSANNNLEFQTFEIDMNEDGFTIDSYPVNEVEDVSTISTYTSAQNPDGTIDYKVTGEYMIAVKENDSYYAFYIDSNGNFKTTDISLLFSGNFLKDSEGNYCISINTQYLWKQTGTVTVSNGVASGLTFSNFAASTTLTLGSSTSLSFDGSQLYSGSTYLTYDPSTGFVSGNSESNYDIILFEVGTNGVAVGADSDTLQYTYFSYALNTSAIDYSYFTYDIKAISELKHYDADENGDLVTEIGWDLNASTKLSEVNESVYFTSGINYNTDPTTFAGEFEEYTYSYTQVDDNNNEVVNNLSYYAPNGTVAFVVPEASVGSPVFVNVIVSTELNKSSSLGTTYESDRLRYLSLWNVATLDTETNTLTAKNGATGTITANDYAQSLISNFYTPTGAMPLPNHYGSVASGASYVKVNETVNNEETQVVYNLSADANFDHLLAHTFTIYTPGVYYIGSTYGTVTFCYVSIDNMLSTDEGEDDAQKISEAFSIDFVWGSIGTTGDFGDEDSLGTITYVGKVTTTTVNDEAVVDKANTWVNSNTYPKFTNGTAGLYTGSEPSDYNPTDYLTLSVTRAYNSTTKISTVTINGNTTEEIYAYGEGVMYLDSNNAIERRTRAVAFGVTYDGKPVLDATITFDDISKRTTYTNSASGGSQIWTENGITLTNTQSTSGEIDSYDPIYLNADSTLTVSYTKNVKKIVFTCSGSSFANALATYINGLSGNDVAIVNGKIVTVTLATEASSYTLTMPQQIGLRSIDVYVTPNN